MLAFLRSQRVPPRKMLRDIGKELGLTLQEMQRILDR